jgi:hypothetical protein
VYHNRAGDRRNSLRRMPMRRRFWVGGAVLVVALIGFGAIAKGPPSASGEQVSLASQMADFGKPQPQVKETFWPDH